MGSAEVGGHDVFENNVDTRVETGCGKVTAGLSGSDDGDRSDAF